MLNKLELKNFKCFEKLKLDLKNLNVLAGINSNGKSTLIQSLLLIRQSYEVNKKINGIYLNGKYVNLGTGRDVLYDEAKTSKFSIKLFFNNNCELCFDCRSDLKSDFQQLSKAVEINNKTIPINLFGDKFSYISSERLGPQKYYKSSYTDTVLNKQIGVHGEYFASYLDDNLTTVVENSKLVKKCNKKNLIELMQYWMNELGFEIQISTKKDIDIGITKLQYDKYTPINVGFGISYVAPVVLALLMAKKGALLIIENPEAHIHPRGQRVLGELIAYVASYGVQVIIETHSDHILNGIRLSVKNKVIANDEVSLNYFYAEKDEKYKKIHKIVNPKINSDGSLTEWPDGFFDEWEKALGEIVV